MAENCTSNAELEAHKDLITELNKKPLKEGDIWYLVENKWYRQWKKYVGYHTFDNTAIGERSAHPGPIDNSPLFKEGSTNELKEHLIDELDYTLVPEEAWQKLYEWYGLAPGQEPIARKVVDTGMFLKNTKVEVYLLELKLCLLTNTNDVKTHKFSKVETIGELERVMRESFGIPPERTCRLWNRYSSNTYEPLIDKTRTIQDEGLYPGQVVAIEVQNEDGTWPRTATARSNSVSSSFNSGTIAASSYNTTTPVTHGLCGLNNLGNTCFMNSALQCMSNTPPLTQYFLEDRHLAELNRDNPLGMRGEIARAYGDLIKIMWSGQHQSTIPRQFKTQVGRFAPQFHGYQQQDCQELMAFLLDGLHEDLNRVKKKPYIETKSADGRNDEVVAKEAWSNYLRRNNSIIVDTFHGLLKSTLVCPDCKHVSVTFDPFCYLSLPLPLKKERQMEIIFFPLQGKGTKLKISLPKTATVQDMYNNVARLMGNLDPEKLLAAEVYNHRFAKIFTPDEVVQDFIERQEIHIYELPVSPSDLSHTVLPVYLREKRNGNNNQYPLFGEPFFVSIAKNDCTYDDLYRTILDKLNRLEVVSSPEESDAYWTQMEQNGNEDADDIMPLAHNGEYPEASLPNGAEDAGSTPRTTRARASLHNNSSNQSDQPQNNTTTTQNRRLFSIQSVNENCSLKMESLADDNNPLKLRPRMYLALDWNAKARQRFYDDKRSQERVIHESATQRDFRPSKHRPALELSDCLELFTTTEQLGADDLWYCPVCKKHQQATKKFDLWSLPQVLIIHLKRFSYSRYFREKLDVLVDFPVAGLDMKPYVINAKHGPAIYDLIAVANHYGGLGGGHYTAYAKNKVTNNWYNFDDSSVSQASEDQVVSKAAYVLFYIRRDGPAPTSSATSPSSSSSAPPRTRMTTRSQVALPTPEEPMDLS